MTIKGKRSINWKFLILMGISITLLFIGIYSKQKESNIVKLLNTIHEIDSSKIFYIEEEETSLSQEPLFNLTNIILLSDAENKIIKRYLKRGEKAELFKIYGCRGNDIILTITAIDVSDLDDQIEYMEFRNNKFILMYKNIPFVAKDIILQD